MTFRLFGRAPTEPPPEPPPAWLAEPPAPRGYGAPEGAGVTWAPGQWNDAGPATRSARPLARDPRVSAYLTDDPLAVHADPGAVHGEEPLTDPHGFPPVPAAERGTSPAPPLAPPGPAPAAPDPAEAAALAGAFAADYLSWDEDDAGRRGRVLGDYLAAPVADPARLGWSGRGRQRAEVVLPGKVEPEGPGRVVVDVRVRIIPYRPVGERDDAVPAEPPAEVAGIPAVAPAPTARGWRGGAARWVRIGVPVVLAGDGRPAVDPGPVADAGVGTAPAPGASDALPGTAAGGAW